MAWVCPVATSAILRARSFASDLQTKTTITDRSSHQLFIYRQIIEALAPTDLELTKMHLLRGSGREDVNFSANVIIRSLMNLVLVFSSAICLAATDTTVG